MNDFDFLTSKELSEKTGISQSQIARRAAAGELPAKKAGHDWIFPAWLANPGALQRRRRPKTPRIAE